MPGTLLSAALGLMMQRMRETASEQGGEMARPTSRHVPELGNWYDGANKRKQRKGGRPALRHGSMPWGG
ncbi:hypothetical protein AMTR_s00053p00095440 [Amborella trichopoda]|uniref:Uncharacterized protein n=1 Tax=Amborella trichopoda TaxID=13333 RepID=W1PBH1_AMBTC|nr:hypothetical protein AMTR_s00053p00095440 [Amborella trichopoda]